MVKRKIDVRRIVISALLGVIFSFFMVIGSQLAANKEIDFSLKTALILVACAAAFSFVFSFLINTTIKYKTNENYRPKKLWIFLGLMTITVLFIFAMYPGNYCYDIFAQLNAYKTGYYTTHYPPLFCMLMGVIIDIGRFIYGIDEGGVVLFILFQAVITNAVIAYIISELSGRLKNKTFHVISCLYIFLHPFIFNIIISTCHDVLFADAFVLLLFEFLKMSEDKDYFSSKKNLAKVLIFVILMCVLRNNGFFALIPVLIVSLVVLREKWAEILIFMISPILLWLVLYCGLFLNLINVNRENIFHESINIPIMQISRTMYYEGDKVWDERINDYFSETCGWHMYVTERAISDAYKVCLKDDVLGRDPLGFVDMWAKMGAKAPNRYIEAAAMQTLTSYYPWVDYDNRSSGVFGAYIEYGVRTAPEYVGDTDVAKPEAANKFPWLHSAIVWLFGPHRGWFKIPVLRLIWGASFSTYLLIITVALVIYKKAKKYLVPLSFVFGMLLTVILAPVIIFRYMFPIVLATPIMLYIIVKVIGEKKENPTHKRVGQK